MNTVTYSGHTASESGVSTWPSRRVTRRWEHVAKIETGLSFDAKTYHARILFTVGKTLTLRGTKFAPSSMRRFAAFLARAIAAAPATAEIDERTREIAQWGGAEMEARLRRLKGIAPSMAQWLEQARFLRARLEHGKALKAVARVLERQPSHVEALELRFQLLEETGAGLPKLIAAAEQVLLHAPDDAAARTRVLGLKLQANDARIVPEVEQVLAREPDNFVLGFALAGYFFRAKDFDRAMAVTDTLAKRPGATAWQRGAAESRDYVQRYATSGTFRAKERLKYWGRIAAVFVPLVLLVAGKWWSVQARQEKREREREATEAQQRTIEQMQRDAETRMNEIEKSTGRTARNYAEIKSRADAGDAAAQLEVADNLFDGEQGATQDVIEAKRYLELAAAQNHRPAVLSLAERLKEGRGMAVDHNQAMAWLEKAVSLDSPHAAVLLGEYYLEGKHVAKDERKAYELFKLSAAGGNTWGHKQLGWALENGLGVEKDVAAAIESYRRAGDRKDIWAHERLAQIFSDRNQPWFNEVEARKWIFQGARLGSDQLRATMLSWFLSGVPGTPDEISDARLWLTVDVARGKAFAQFYAGRAAWLGWLEPRRWEKAVTLYAQAAEQDYPPAIHLYARCLAGGVGVPQDLRKARKLRDRLVELKESAAQVKKLDELIAAMAQPLPPAPIGMFRPKPIWQEGPLYPWPMAQANISGHVDVEFIIGQDGRTIQAQVVNSSHAEFEVPALTAVSFWRFVPGSKDGRRVNVRVSQRLEFSMEHEKAPDAAGATSPLPPVEK